MAKKWEEELDWAVAHALRAITTELHKPVDLRTIVATAKTYTEEVKADLYELVEGNK